VEDLSNDIEDFTPDICIVDTPGQMELFAFRDIGAQIAQELTDVEKGVIYIFDGVQCSNPLNYVSNLFLSAAVYNRFFVPQTYVLSKCDLLPSEDVNRIIDWSTSPNALEMTIEEKLSGTRRLLSRDMAHAVYQLGLRFLLIPVSAKTNEGLTNLNAMLERVSTEGEKFTS
ncbi:ATP/GTP-binding protein, partial [Candidatus Bathyarchaeota archaeon]|nr:ATP/GTP-binding protein [Candidatus Bathyarchaeota archaeon]